MEIAFLHHFGFPADLIDSLRSEYGDHLLPLQEKVIQEGRLFEQANLLVCAPTSSGKTFLSEILFLHQALQGRNAILLAPTKALAAQRYQQWRRRYGALGYDVLLSTRDHPIHDRRIVEGRFHLAIVIYEKMRALLSQNPSFLASLGACVIDEIHYLFHPTRGFDLEMLLTRLLEEPHLQLLGLSAMVSDSRVADWLNARLIVEAQRPVELRQGVLCRGNFTYREFNSGEEGVERFMPSDAQDEGEAMLEAARFFAARGETTLLFWPLRDYCYTAARKLAEQYEAEDDFQIPELDSLEPTAMRDFLAYLLPRRIAVHTSDLSPSEREWIEALARQGEIMLICATSTLAEGINFPVVNVLTTRRMYASRPQDAQSGRPPISQPLTQDRLHNMIGRAGRLGLSPFGRGIIVTTSPGDVAGLMSHYIHSNPPAFTPVLNQSPAGRMVLSAMGCCGAFTIEACRKILQHTMSGQWGLLSESIGESLIDVFQSLVDKGFLSEELGVFHPTPLGDLIRKSGLSEMSAERINDYVLHSSDHDFSTLDEIVFICTLQEMSEVHLAVSRNEIRLHSWSRTLSQRCEASDFEAGSFVKKLLSEPARLRPEHHEAFKKALLILDWLGGGAIPELERRFGVYSGLILHVAEESSWLIGCMAETAASHALSKSWLDHLLELKERLLCGISPSGLHWAPWIRRRLLTRGQVLKLLDSGFDNPSSILPENYEMIRTMMPPESVDALLQNRDQPNGNASGEDSFTLVFDPSRPDVMIVNGVQTSLTPLQSKLIDLLSQHEGCCVPYDELLEYMWPDSLGDRKQISRQKNQILRKVSLALNQPVGGLIKSIAGVGLALHAQIDGKK
ncbi:MAG: DEAD/DEAH box helicase [Candidatus Omnitrophica bacterium]|nr:DEAD/DEAH box helicase [Candidatus Omnitrophota bacterium]